MSPSVLQLLLLSLRGNGLCLFGHHYFHHPLPAAGLVGGWEGGRMGVVIDRGEWCLCCCLYGMLHVFCVTAVLRLSLTFVIAVLHIMAARGCGFVICHLPFVFSL